MWTTVLPRRQRPLGEHLRFRGRAHEIHVPYKLTSLLVTSAYACVDGQQQSRIRLRETGDEFSPLITKNKQKFYFITSHIFQ